MSAQALLAATGLEAFLQANPKSLATLRVDDNLGKASHTMAANNLLSLPVFDLKGEYAGCLSTSDLLAAVAAALSAKNAHWVEKGVSAEDLKAVGLSLRPVKVGDLEHSGSLWMVGTGLQASLLDVVKEAFSINDPHHVHHRVYIAAAGGAAAGHTATGADARTTVVSGASSKLRVSHVLTHTDIVRLLKDSAAQLGDLPQKTVEELELDAGAVFCVPETITALEAFGRMAADQKSSLGLVDAAGVLVGNISASDLRGLSAEDFDQLLLPAPEYLAVRRGPPAQVVVSVTRQSTLAEVLDALVGHRIHRVYVVDEAKKPVSIITLTDILRLAIKH